MSRLEKAIPHPQTALSYRTPFELLVATILSAQCTDLRVNQVTPLLFKSYRTVSDFAKADPEALEALIRPTGFYKNKAKAIIGTARMLMEQFRSQVPKTMDQLVLLPGVGRKTANVLLGQAFGLPAIVVDTHVRRVSRRLGLTLSNDPDTIEIDLGRQMPPSAWTQGASRLLLHGRHICRARAPLCSQCSLYDLCPNDVDKKKALSVEQNKR